MPVNLFRILAQRGSCHQPRPPAPGALKSSVQLIRSPPGSLSHFACFCRPQSALPFRKGKGCSSWFVHLLQGVQGVALGAACVAGAWLGRVGLLRPDGAGLCLRPQPQPFPALLQDCTEASPPGSLFWALRKEAGGRHLDGEGNQQLAQG